MTKLLLALLPLVAAGSVADPIHPDFSGTWERVDADPELPSVASAGDVAFRSGQHGERLGIAGHHPPGRARARRRVRALLRVRPAASDPADLRAGRLGIRRTSVMIGHAASAQRSRVAWRDRTLVITTELPARCRAASVRVRQALTLESPDTLQVETTREGVRWRAVFGHAGDVREASEAGGVRPAPLRPVRASGVYGSLAFGGTFGKRSRLAVYSATSLSKTAERPRIRVLDVGLLARIRPQVEQPHERRLRDARLRHERVVELPVLPLHGADLRAGEDTGRSRVPSAAACPRGTAAMSMPSIARSVGRSVMPAAAAIVGKMSSSCTISFETWPGGMRPGQRMTHGVRMPPSITVL